MKVSPNFSRSEFACKCGCGFDSVDAELIEILEDLRTHFGGRSVIVNSGARCELYNKKIGGAVSSKHLSSRAADIVVNGIAPVLVYEYLRTKYPDKYGIGKYRTFTHIDSRKTKARW